MKTTSKREAIARDLKEHPLDTLTAIARRHGVTVGYVWRVNRGARVVYSRPIRPARRGRPPRASTPVTPGKPTATP